MKKPPLVVHIDPASQSTVKFGKRLCEEAKTGHSIGVAAVVLRPRGRFYLELTGAANRNPTFACGAVNALRKALEQLMEEGPT